MPTDTTGGIVDPNINKEYENSNPTTQDHAAAHLGNGTNGNASYRGYDYGGNPLAHTNTGNSARFPAFGGEFQPGLYKPTTSRKLANPAPLGLAAFALTTFILSIFNIGVRGVTTPNLIVGAAFGYGGLVQFASGMWEMAVGNTFGATALASYGGFWISFAIILTPGGFDIASAYATVDATGAPTGVGINDMNYALGYFLAGWFIFTTLLLSCTLKSTLAFFSLFFFLDLAFLFLSLAHLYADSTGAINVPLNKAGGYFGIFAAFAGWYNALAGLADSSNSFFVIPVVHFPWSEKGRELRNISKTERETV